MQIPREKTCIYFSEAKKNFNFKRNIKIKKQTF